MITSSIRFKHQTSISSFNYLPSQPAYPSRDQRQIRIANSKVLKLEIALATLKSEHESVFHESEAAYLKIRLLEAVKLEPNEETEQTNSLLDSLNVKVSDLSEENESLVSKIKSQSDEIQDLERLNKRAREASNKLNKKLVDAKVQFKKEKAEITKEYKTDVKAWKKDLDEERRQREKLEKKVNETHAVTDEDSSKDLESTTSIKTEHLLIPDETLCSICAHPIVNYIPKYFLSQRYSPTCENCDDDSDISVDENSLSEENMEIFANHPITKKGFNHHPTFDALKASIVQLGPRLVSYHCNHNQQCIIRQPFPPPLHSLTPIVNEYSLYHVKIMAGELDWGSTCWYCMRIDCDNYGCESCVWIKHFGELHGYPDINPSEYKLHL